MARSRLGIAAHGPQNRIGINGLGGSAALAGWQGGGQKFGPLGGQTGQGVLRTILQVLQNPG